ncbi:thioredoxin [Natronobiforma cellulositropha]|nr:thioredoxin family protein [Natronobiforma cellulositropha]
MGVEVLTFHAEWCGPCTQQEPVVAELEGEYEEVAFTSLDVEDHVETAKAYDVNTVPTLVILADDEVEATLTGYQPRAQIEDHLRQLL